MQDFPNYSVELSAIKCFDIYILEFITLKRKIVLTESELVNLAMRIAEQVNLDLYDDEDFLDAFFQSFRVYVSRFHGTKSLNYPISYLLRKYSKPYVLHHLGMEGLKKHARYYEGDDIDTFGDDFVISRWDAIEIIKEIINKDKYQLPKLFQKEKFTEKFNSIIDRYIKEEMGLPDYVRVTLDEPDPHYFIVNVYTDVDKWFKDPNKVSVQRRSIEDKLKKFMENYLGLEFGTVKYGQSEFGSTNNQNHFEGLDSWIKNELNGKIKKAFKASPESKYVKSIKFDIDGNRGSLIPTYNSSTGYQGRTKVFEEYTKLLNSMGYGPNLRFERN